MFWKWFSFTILTTALVQAQVPAFGQCPDVKVIENFEPKQYLGIWYEYEKYPFVFELLGKCVHAEYGMNDNGTISVVNSQINRITGTKSRIAGHAEIKEPGKLLVKFPGATAKDGSNYWILGTDYTSYAVVFSCTDAGKVVNGRVVWILTRERHPTEQTVSAAHDILDKNKLSKSLLIKTNQSECPNVNSFV